MTTGSGQLTAGMPTFPLHSLDVPPARGDEAYVARVANQPLAPEAFATLKPLVHRLGVTPEFRAVVDHFRTPDCHTPPGFRVEYRLETDGLLAIDLVRDLSYDADGVLRPTKVLFSADSANPYEIAPISGLIANLTCNPGIIYDLFINDPKVNIDHKFTTRDEVIQEIGHILGPGCDISVELNNPFARDVNEILEEAEKFREMLSPWRVVIKVPHTGPVNADNVHQLLHGDGRLDRRWDHPTTEDALRGHNLALLLHEHGFRVNFTLMFEPYQAQLALQARPYFINAFIRHRLLQSQRIAAHLRGYDDSGDERVLAELRDYMLATDYFASTDTAIDLHEVLEAARWIVKYRGIEGEGADGLDGLRHNLRVLRVANLPDTRLIVCSMEGASMYPDIDRVVASEEFADMAHRVVITAEPNYLARFTSASQVISYQRRFMKAAQGQS